MQNKKKPSLPTEASTPNVFLLKLRFSRLKLIFLSVYLFVWELIFNVVQLFTLVFGDTAQSFDMLFKQKSLTVCNYSYSQFKKLQQRAKVFSVAGITTIVTVTVIVSLIINLATGPITQILAATFNFQQQSWSDGTSGTAATHASNQSGWTYYASKDAGVVAGANLTVSTGSGDVTVNGVANNFTDTGYSAPSNLTVAAGSVKLLKPTGAVCDVNGECASGECLTSCDSSGIYITYSGRVGTGSMGGRSGARTTCEDVDAVGNWAPSNASRVQPFLSVAGDELKDYPATYGYPTNISVYWYNSSGGTTIIDNTWADLWAGGILNDGNSAGMPTLYGGFWTGTNTDGTIDTGDSCGDWTIGTTGDKGSGGPTSSGWTSTGWINNGAVFCNQSRYLYCVFCLPNPSKTCS